MTPTSSTVTPDIEAPDADEIRVYIDDEDEPTATYSPPARVELDTQRLNDGQHILRVEALQGSGTTGVKQIPFYVRNGPAISVEGLRKNETVEGELSLLVHAYGGGTEGEFDPEKAETPAPIPTWAWVLIIIIFAWAMYYTIQYWNPTAEYRNSPTYRPPASTQPK